MPTVADLQRLAALVDQLTPLTQIQRGELIQARHWNTVVGALIDVAAAVLTEDVEDVVAPHIHPDQVTVGWLDPALRTLIERGPLADPAAVARVAALERKLENLANQLDESQDRVAEVRDRIAEVSTRDLAREADIQSIQRVIRGIADARDDVLALRGTLRTIERDVLRAIDIGQRLILNGEPADIEVIDSRIRAVEALRERLELPNGELLDALALEQRFEQLENTLVTEEELNMALDSLSTDISEEELSALEDRIRMALRDEFNETREQFRKSIQDEVTKRLNGVQALIEQAVSDALPNLATSILNTVRSEIAQAVSRVTQTTQAFFENRLSETTTLLRQEIEQGLQDVETKLAQAVQDEFDRQLPTALNAIRQAIVDLQQRMEKVEAGLREQQENFRTLGLRVEAGLREQQEHFRTLSLRVETGLQQAEASRVQLRQALISEMGQRDQALRSQMDEKFAQIDRAIDEIRNQIQTRPQPHPDPEQ